MANERITLLVPTLGGGGAERIMVTLANELAGRGYPVDLLTFTAEGPFRSIVRDEVRLVDLETRRARSSVPALARYLRSHRPAGLLASQTHTNVVAVLARLLAGTPTRVVLREENTLSVDSRSANFGLHKLVPWAAHWAYRRADRVIAVSQGAAADLRKALSLPEEDVEVIANPVAAQAIAREAEEPLEHPWFAPGEPPVVLGVGRLRPAKDFPNLLRAFKSVLEQRPARLMVLGEGDQRAALEALAAELGIADAVALPGFVANPFQYMRRAGVFVLSSAWEGLPGALLEAMACGCPVVSTDCPSGPREILEGGRYGPLVPVGDSAALARAVVATLDDPVPAATLTASVQRYAIPAIADRYVELLLGSGARDAVRAPTVGRQRAGSTGAD